MQDTNFISIQGWMRTELNLSGNELLVYAIIYGFSQDGESKFTGSRQYLADWCGCTVRNIQLVLNDLVNKGLLTKTEQIHNNVKTCEYVANFTPSEKISRGSEKISLNNIVDNIDSNTSTINSESIYNTDTPSKDEFEGHSYSKNDFLGSAKRVSHTKRKSLYMQCEEEILMYTKNLALQDVLIQYLKLRLANKDKPMYGINQWKGMLNRLDELAKEANTNPKNYCCVRIDIVKQSIERGWASFFQLSGTKPNKDKFAEYGTVDCTKNKDEESVDEEF